MPWADLLASGVPFSLNNKLHSYFDEEVPPIENRMNIHTTVLFIFRRLRFLSWKEQEMHKKSTYRVLALLLALGMLFSMLNTTAVQAVTRNRRLP